MSRVESPHFDLGALHALILSVLSKAPRSRRRGDEEERVQNVWVRVLRALPSYEPHPEGMRPWISRIVYNLVLDEMRGRKRGGKVFDDADEHAVDMARAPGRSPERAASLCEIVKRLEGAIRTMPAKERAVFDLYVSEGLGHAEIGRRLGISEAASKMRYMRAKEHLRSEVPGLDEELDSALPPLPFASRAERAAMRFRELYDRCLPLALFCSALGAGLAAEARFSPIASAEVGLQVPSVEIEAPPAVEPAPITAAPITSPARTPKVAGKPRATRALDVALRGIEAAPVEGQ